MRINPVPIVLRIMGQDDKDDPMTYGEVCGRAHIAPETLKKIREGKLVSLKSLKRLCLCLGVNPREVIIHDVAFTQTQGAENMGDGKRAPAYFNGADKSDTR
jgi:DNA-binding Xre family transcriptional regulator